MCQVMKLDNRSRAGSLRPLEIPIQKEAHINIDLEIDLHDFESLTSIVAFVENLTKIIPFVTY